MNLSALTIWYSRQSARDQLVLRIGAVLVGAILLLWLLLPLHRNLQAAREQLQNKQIDLEWMRQVGPTLAAAGPGVAQQPLNEPLVVLIDRSARESGLAQALTGSQPAANGAMRVQFENADFRALVAWLSRLSAQHGIRIENGNVTASGGRGMVNAAMQLRAAAAN